MKNVIFIAPPAAGKGTCSDFLKAKFGYKHISTGDLLRNVDKESELGKEISSYINKGELVPDIIINKLLQEALDTYKGNPIILDGYPRNVKQAELLETIFDNYVAIYLDIEKETAMKRMLGRITCPKCKKTYNKYFDKFKPKNEGLCDECNSELVSRNDDTKETFDIRFDTYINNTLPLLEYYDKKDVLKKVSKDTTETDDILSSIEGFVND